MRKVARWWALLAMAACSSDLTTSPIASLDGPESVAQDRIEGESRTTAQQLALIDGGLRYALGSRETELRALRSDLVQELAALHREGEGWSTRRAAIIAGRPWGGADVEEIPAIIKNSTFTYAQPFMEERQVIVRAGVYYPAFIMAAVHATIDPDNGAPITDGALLGSVTATTILRAVTPRLGDGFNCTQGGATMTANADISASWSALFLQADIDTWQTPTKSDSCAPWGTASISGAVGSLKVGQLWILSSNCMGSASWSGDNPAVAHVTTEISTGAGLVIGESPGEVNIRVDCPSRRLRPAGINVTVEQPPQNETCGTAELRAPRATGATAMRSLTRGAPLDLPHDEANCPDDDEEGDPGGELPPFPAPEGCDWYRDWVIIQDNLYWLTDWYLECEGDEFLRAEEQPRAGIRSPGTPIALRLVAGGALPKGGAALVMQAARSHDRFVLAIDTTRTTAADLARALKAASRFALTATDHGPATTRGSFLALGAEVKSRASEQESAAAALLRQLLASPARAIDRIGAGRVIDVELDLAANLIRSPESRQDRQRR